MSLTSYGENLALGVTGPNTNTCFTAAIEMLVPGSVDPSTHMAYEGYARAEGGLHHRKRSAIFDRILDRVATDIGLDGHNDFDYYRVNKLREFGILLRKLFKDGMATILDIEAPGDQVVYDPEYHPHAIGLIPLSVKRESFKVVGTWLPDGLEPDTQYVPEDLFDRLIFPSDKPQKKWPFFDSNVTAVPGLDPTLLSQEPNGWINRRMHSRTRGTGPK